MRSYTINEEKTATIRNLYNGDEFTARFPMDEDELYNIADRASCHGSHDYIVVNVEGLYNLISSDYVSIMDVNDAAERVELLEDDDADKLEAMAEVMGDLDYIERVWDDTYFIPNTTMADYAQELCYDCGYMPADDLPEWISCHIDWEGVGRELSDAGYSEINGGVLCVAR